MDERNQKRISSQMGVGGATKILVGAWCLSGNTGAFQGFSRFWGSQYADIHGHLLINGVGATIPTLVITQLTTFLTYSAISFGLNINKLAVLEETHLRE